MKKKFVQDHITRVWGKHTSKDERHDTYKHPKRKEGQMNKKTYTQMYRHTDGQTDRQNNKQTDQRTDGQTKRQTD